METLNAKILVVDDEIIVRESMLNWLSEEGYFVEVAENADQCFKKLGEQEFDIVFLDIKMPEVDGIEVLKKIKEIYPIVDVVMITALNTSLSL